MQTLETNMDQTRLTSFSSNGDISTDIHKVHPHTNHFLSLLLTLF